MADGLVLNPGAAGATLATDDAGAAGHVQVVKLAVSTDGSATALTADNTNGLLADVKRVQGNVTVVGAAADGAAASGNPVLVAGFDGTNAQSISTTAGGLVNVADGGGTLTVDDGGSSLTVDNGGTFAVQAAETASTIPAATTMQNAATANGNGTNLPVTGYSTAVLNVVSSVSMAGGTTINFEASVDDTTFVAIGAQNVATGAIVTTTTADGDFRLTTAGYKSVRARISAYSAGTITVKGYTIVQSGTALVATQPISAASLPLPSGAATAAKQPALGTAGSASTDVITIQGIASGTVVPISVATIPSHAVTNAGTFAVQESGSQVQVDAGYKDLIVKENTGSQYFMFYAQNGTTGVDFYINQTTNYAPAITPTAGRWYYIASVYDAAASTLQHYWIDLSNAPHTLTADSAFTSVLNPDASTADLQIGSSVWADGGTDMALVRWWDKALSAQEVSHVAARTIPGKFFSNLIFNWDASLDRGTGVTAAEFADIANGVAAATVSGTPSRSAASPPGWRGFLGGEIMLSEEFDSAAPPATSPRRLALLGVGS